MVYLLTRTVTQYCLVALRKTPAQSVPAVNFPAAVTTHKYSVAAKNQICEATTIRCPRSNEHKYCSTSVHPDQE